jgi:DNA mismatch endonuclease, patch repair protein
MDNLTPEQRRFAMFQVKSKDTTPEKNVRSLLHRLGFRFRLHCHDLPGKPDIVLPKYKSALFVHGCFWHRHKNCVRATTPKTNVDYWQKKFTRNVERDRRVQQELLDLGWQVIVVWECELKDRIKLAERLTAAFKNDNIQPVYNCHRATDHHEPYGEN